MPRIPLNPVNSFIKGDLFIQIIQNLLIAQSLHGNHAAVIPHFLEVLHFINQSVLHHFVHAPFNSFIQPLPVIV